jgi:Natural resistance-associated macrophage protein
MTGVPQAMASIITSPKGSGQSMGKRRASAPPRMADLSVSPISPMNSTSGSARIIGSITFANEFRKRGLTASLPACFLEAFVIALILVVAICFAVQIVAAAPPVAAMLSGFLPSSGIVTNPEMLYIAMGIIGATVMPHSLYLHSSIVQTRAFERFDNGRRRAIKWAAADSTIALRLALFVNAAILIVAAATFHTSGHADVKEIEQAYELLSPLLGLGIASALFAVGPASRGNEFIRDSDPRGSWRVFAEEDLPPDRRGGPYRRFRSVNVVDLVQERLRLIEARRIKTQTRL